MREYNTGYDFPLETREEILRQSGKYFPSLRSTLFSKSEFKEYGKSMLDRLTHTFTVDKRGNSITTIVLPGGKVRHSTSQPAYVKRDKQGRITQEKWYYLGKLERRDADSISGIENPSITKYKNGNKYLEQWKTEGRPRWVSKEYYPNGNVKKITFYLNKKRDRREDAGPAVILYNEDGSINEEHYMKDDLLHREKYGLPGFIKYRADENNIPAKTIVYLFGKQSIVNDEPSVVTYNKQGDVKEEQWILSGHILNRAGDKPARISYYKNGNKKKEEWFRQNNYYRDNLSLPTYISYYENGNKKKEVWYKNNLIHRDSENNSLPAIIEYNEDGTINREQWYLYDELIKTETY